VGRIKTEGPKDKAVLVLHAGVLSRGLNRI